MYNAQPSSSAREPIVEDHESRGVVARIAHALPPLERAYAYARFVILRQQLLALMNLALPDEGRILDVGCGFGLFSAYFELTCPRRHIVGVDPDARRVDIARGLAAKLALPHVEYRAGTVETAGLEGKFDAIFMLDVLHHVAPAGQFTLLRTLRDMLAADGVMLIKDVTTDEPLKLGFTRLLDRMMVGLEEPLGYRHHHDWSRMLGELGLQARIVRVQDALPYPHVVLVARAR